MGSVTSKVKNSILTGFINENIKSDPLYQPELLTNDKSIPSKISTALQYQLNTCHEFFISVAFVTTSGVAVLINTLLELEEKGVSGKVLVSQYLNFTQPEALKRLLQLKNIDLRIATKVSSHTKGYIFKNDEHLNLIVGSSNLTSNALSVNKEWNLKVSALHESSIAKRILSEFIKDFKSSRIVDLEYIKNYEKIYLKQQLLAPIFSDTKNEIKPNSMQQKALINLKNLRVENKKKALLISATGTGKTYLSAFDAKEFNPKRLLFIVHRLNIAKKAMHTFQKVFDNKKSFGVYSGEQRDLDKDFIFSTVQTISRESHLSKFNKDHFDYIIIDESHRSSANSYLKITDYFQPGFLLGMTATPERTDDNDIFSIFDHNIAYEIRLHKAMEEEMLCPFHYYGVSDIALDKVFLDNTNFNRLLFEERASQIIAKSKFYGTDNGITRGLIFCSRNEEAKELSGLFNQRGLKTVHISGSTEPEEREEAIRRLESEDLSEKIDYILTVDVFNEGIDIPKLNQIIMVRPTESAIVFIQQLGRGLRKSSGKDYLTIIDFIGNYNNNYLIPIALYGDTSFNKDTIRKLISEGSKLLPGSSTINFDRITKEKIFNSIDSANMKLLTDLKKDYSLLKYRLGRPPMMMDFMNHETRDPFLFVEYSRSYYNFSCKVDNDIKQSLRKDSILLLELFSKEINNCKRIEESFILLKLILNHSYTIDKLKEDIQDKYGYSISSATIKSCLRNLNFLFVRKSKNKKLTPLGEVHNLRIENLEENLISIDLSFNTALQDTTFKRYLIDSIHYALNRYDSYYSRELWQDGFILYQKYSRKDVFRILNYIENPVAINVGGYLVSPNNSNCPIFVNYHKDEGISESTKYEDKFINQSEFEWQSKSKRTLQSNDVQTILGKKGEIRLPLFIKKKNDEGDEFYYMGNIFPIKERIEETTIQDDKGNLVPIVRINFKLESQVESGLYNYIIEDSTKTVRSSDVPLNVEAEET